MFTAEAMACIVGAVAIAVALVSWVVFPRKVTVPQGYVAALYRNGRFRRLLGVGAHWCGRIGLSYTLVDTRRQVATIAGQEVLTRDNVSLKVSVACQFSVDDADKALHAVQNYAASLYLAVQLALREVVAAIDAEHLIDSLQTLSAALTERVGSAASELGLRIEAAEVKDLMLPSDLKRAFSDVLKARKDAQAALERTRGESASLRNLANAARLMDTHPALLSLRVLGSIDQAGRVGGNTLVMAMPEVLPTPRGAAR